jgi:regulator of sigma D
MDANQLSLAEQKQVYETIKEDYEKLLKVVDRKKNTELDMDL